MRLKRSSILPVRTATAAAQGRDDMVAVHAVCEEEVFWTTMEDLRSRVPLILVVPIEKMLD